MSYETERDFTRFLESFPARGQIPGALPQELPHVLFDGIQPTTDALGWFRFATESQTEDVFVTNLTIVALAVVPSGIMRLCWGISVRHEDAATTQILSLEKIIPGLAPSVGLTEAPVAGTPAFTSVGQRRPVLVLPGERLQGRAFPGTGVAAVLRITCQFVDLPIGESVVGM